MILFFTCSRVYIYIFFISLSQILRFSHLLVRIFWFSVILAFSFFSLISSLTIPFPSVPSILWRVLPIVSLSSLFLSLDSSYPSSRHFPRWITSRHTLMKEHTRTQHFCIIIYQKKSYYRSVINTGMLFCNCLALLPELEWSVFSVQQDRGYCQYFFQLLDDTKMD